MTELRDRASTYREGLEALRDVLADAVVYAESPHGKAALAKVMLDTMQALEAHEEPVKKEGTGLDEFTRALRDKRGSGAAS